MPRRWIVAVVIVCIVIAGGSTPSSRALAALPPQPAVPHRSSSHSAIVNPHLHGLVHHARDVRTGADRHHHGRWSRYWNSSAWFATHRGTGTIRGFVRTSDGRTVAGATVHLRNRHNRAFHSVAAKHYTVTGRDGSFVMFHVRAGRYRVLSTVAHHDAHATLSVHSGRTAEASIKM